MYVATFRTLRRGPPSRLTLTRFVGGGVAGARRAGVRRADLAGLAARRASAAAALATARSAASAERESASAVGAQFLDLRRSTSESVQFVPRRNSIHDFAAQS